MVTIQLIAALVGHMQQQQSYKPSSKENGQKSRGFDQTQKQYWKTMKKTVLLYHPPMCAHTVMFL